MKIKFSWPASLKISRPGRDASLRRQLLFGTSALLLAVLLGGSVGIAAFLHVKEQAVWRERQREAALNVAQSAASFIKYQQGVLSILESLDVDELQEHPHLLNDLLYAHPSLLEVAHLDASGHVLIGYPQEDSVLAGAEDTRQSRWFENAQAGKLAFSELRISPSDEPYVVMAMPASFGRVLAARLDMRTVWQEIARVEMGENVRAYIVDRQGVVIAHPDSSFVLSRTNIDASPVLQNLLLTPGFSWYHGAMNLEGIQVAGAKAPVEGSGWMVITEVPAWALTASFRNIWLLLLGGSAVLFFLVGRLNVNLFERLVLQPLYRLQIGARQVGQGNLDYRVAIHSQDELGQVAEAFNQMAANLGEREHLLADQADALRELNEQLEERVEERTALLSQANTDLLREVDERQAAEALLKEHSETLQRKTYQQERLFETARQLTTSLDLHAVLGRVGQGARDITDSQGCTIYLLEEDQWTLKPVIAIDPEYEQEILATIVTLDNSLNGQAVKACHGLIFNNTIIPTGYQVPGTPVEPEERLIVAPLIADGEVLGTICLNRFGRAFTEEDLALTETFAAFASTGIKNAQAHSKLQSEIDERRRAEEALRESEERFMLATRGANDGLWDWDLKSNTIYFSSRWKSMLGYQEEAIGSSPEEWFSRIHPDDLDQVKVDLSAHLQGLTPHFESEHRIRNKEGSYRWVLTRGLAVRSVTASASGPALSPAYRMAGSQTDITAHKEAEEQLLHDAFHDALTGLPNRALFQDRLGRAIERSNRRTDQHFAVLLLDLDRFKVVNDSLGHTTGDQMLVGVARRLSDCLRASDTAARVGGDEFLLLLEDLQQPSDALVIAGRIQEALKQPFDLGDKQVVTSASIGIVQGGDGYDKPADLLRDADIALYRAKILGRARFVVFEASLRTQAIARLELENELRVALERQEFHLHYQPIFALQNDRLTGFEALLRWCSPSRGLVSPAEFIPVAEETGLIIAIGEWVLCEACRQVRRWQDQFPASPPLAINVNISGVQLAHPMLVEQVEQALRQADLSPSCLHLEITESVFMENAEQANAILLKLQDLGVQIQIDDFGTGYSSLAYLQRFPIDTIKIDRSFVGRIGMNGDRAEIVKTIVALAKDLGMQAVAEGVETAEQLAQLKALKCPFGQGYYIARPMDRTAAEAYLSDSIK